MSPKGARRLTAGATVLLAVAAAGAAGGSALRARYADGPPPGHTGGFAEPTCHVCHFDRPLGDGAAIGILGLPDVYAAGRRYPLTVVVTGTGSVGAGGFQLSARFPSGRQAGTLRPVDSATQIVAEPSSGIQYISHTRSGTAVAARDTARWLFEWRAPMAPGRVVFHAAGNAANGDDSQLGDAIDTTSRTVPAGFTAEKE